MNHRLGLRLLASFTTVLAVLVAAVGLLFSVVSIWRNTLPYNSEGNYFDGEANYHEQSVLAYALLAGVSFLVALVLFGIRILLKRGGKRLEEPAHS